MTDLPALLDLKEANGLEMGRVLQCHLIASKMRKDLVNHTIGYDIKVRLIIDKSRTVSKKRFWSYVYIVDC
jgi:hypothetical protein